VAVNHTAPPIASAARTNTSCRRFVRDISGVIGRPAGGLSRRRAGRPSSLSSWLRPPTRDRRVTSEAWMSRPRLRRRRGSAARCRSGVLDEDPHLAENAKRLPERGYEPAAEMAAIATRRLTSPPGSSASRRGYGETGWPHEEVIERFSPDDLSVLAEGLERTAAQLSVAEFVAARPIAPPAGCKNAPAGAPLRRVWSTNRPRRENALRAAFTTRREGPSHQC
jgi:hypothetical protein